MHELSFGNIEQISSDVRREEITFSHLAADLIDHICCDVESEMQKGFSFAEAYRKVKYKMGSGRRLKEIQEDTLYAVDTKYRKMKNTMKISGIAGTVLLGFAALFKIMQWPFASVLLVTGVAALALFFLPSALGALWKETHSPKRLFLFISAFLAFFFLFAGVLFKVMHWPGAAIALSLSVLSAVLFFIPALTVDRFRDPEVKNKRPVYIVGALGIILTVTGMFFKIMHWPLATIFQVSGMLILFIVVFPWYTFITWKNDNTVSSMFIYLVVGSIALLMPASLLNISLQRTFTEGYYVHMDKEQKLYCYLQEKAAACLVENADSESYRVMEELHNKTTDLVKTINNAELKMLELAERKNGQPAADAVPVRLTESAALTDFRLIRDPFSWEPFSIYLAPGTETRTGLEKALSDYRSYMTTLDSVLVDQNPGILTALAEFLPSGTGRDERITMMTGLHMLEVLKNSIMALEAETLVLISKAE